MMLRRSKHAMTRYASTVLMATVLLGCAQVSSGRWYDSEKQSRVETPAVDRPSAAERLADIWGRVTTAIDRRPEAKKKRQARAAKSQAIVKKGDTYYSLAQRHNVPLNALLQANKARPPYELAAGDRLVLPQQAFYKVRTKDTLYSISRSHNTDAASLARLNGISEPYTISVGQMLQIPGAAAVSTTTSSAKPKPQKQLPQAPRRVGRFQVPVKGRVISNYGPKEGGLHNDGINIAARTGTPIRAAENGVVVYAGNELRGYGNLLLIRHSGGWVTAYAHASKFLVKPGDRVRQGDKVAEVGQTGNVDRPQLHFELRKGTRAVNPKSLI